MSNDTRLNEIELLCVGNAIVDVFAKDDGGLALRYGLNKPVQHVKLEKLKALLSELGETSFVSGGGAANAAKIAALLGAKVGFTGAVGDDDFRQIFQNELKSAGVKTNLVQKRSPTGICLVLKTGDGTRTAASPSAALELSEEDINEEEIRKAKVVVIDGFMLGRRGLARRLLELAVRHGAATAIDLGSAAIAEEEAKEIVAYDASLDAPSNVTSARRQPLFLFMNEEEAEAFYNRNDSGQGWEPAAAFEQTLGFSIFKSLTKKRPSLVIVVKLGKRGAICFTGGKTFHAKTKAVEPVETTGAGDAFCGAFLAAWARGKVLADCAALGNKAAGIVLGGVGTKVDKNAFKDLAALLK